MLRLFTAIKLNVLFDGVNNLFDKWNMRKLDIFYVFPNSDVLCRNSPPLKGPCPFPPKLKKKTVDVVVR